MWEGLHDDRFLILPHPEVARSLPRAGAPDTWLAGMRRVQRRVDADRADDTDREGAERR